MAWFRRPHKPLQKVERKDVPTDVFEKCQGCGEILYSERLSQNHFVCPGCSHHFRYSAPQYLSLLLDEGSFEETDDAITSADPLEFVDLKPYAERLRQARAKSGRESAVITGDSLPDLARAWRSRSA